jgi:hypothetical protein
MKLRSRGKFKVNHKSKSGRTGSVQAKRTPQSQQTPSDLTTGEAKMDRVEFKLSRAEQDHFNDLRPLPGEALDFWRAVAVTRGLDPQTILPVRLGGWDFTGLPVGHSHHWCWPIPLKCKHKPAMTA